MVDARVEKWYNPVKHCELMMTQGQNNNSEWWKEIKGPQVSSCKLVSVLWQLVISDSFEIDKKTKQLINTAVINYHTLKTTMMK